MTDFATALQGYHRTEWEFPELRSLPAFSAAWYEKWRELHLAKYPESDIATRANLDMFVDRARTQEGQK